MINYIVMTTTYIFFHRALKAQGIDRTSLPYTGWFQPYCAWIGLVWMILIVGCYGYSSFLPFSVGSFFSYYTMVLVAPITYFGWKLIHRTKIVHPLEADLVWDRPIIDAYEESFISPPTGFWTEMLQLVTFRKSKDNDVRSGSVVV